MPEVLFSLGATEMSGEAPKASREAARKTSTTRSDGREKTASIQVSMEMILRSYHVSCLSLRDQAFIDNCFTVWN